MVKHDVFFTLILILSGSLTFAEAQPEGATPAKNTQRPNILLISIDDLRPDLGSYGHPIAKTPSLDSFAQSGLLFERAYTHQAISGPSRASLMTGLRPATTGIKRLQQTVSNTVPAVVTLNKIFKQNGYETISVGKIYHDINDDLDGWSTAPYDVSYGMRRAREQAGIPRPAYESRDSEELLPDAKNVNHALDELERLSQLDNPFFLAVGLHSPHLPFRAPKNDWDKYDPQQIPAPLTTKPQVDAPYWAVVAWEIWRYDNLPPKPGPMPLLEGNKLRHGYLAAVSFADGLVGEILTKVSTLGLDDNTIVVIWSDHGFKLGDHGGWAKHSTVELDIHIPMMIRVPGMTSTGARTAALVETVDIYPTLIDLAGLSEPHVLEGTSMRPLLNKPQQIWKQAVFAQYPRWVKKQPLMGETVRTQRYRYTAWVGEQSGQIVAQELYDHAVDPIEARNVAYDTDHFPELQRHEKLRLQGWQEVKMTLQEKIVKPLIEPLDEIINKH